MFYEGEDGIGVDKEKSLRYFMMAAYKGDVESMYKCGLMLYEGDGCKIDKEKAAEF